MQVIMLPYFRLNNASTYGCLLCLVLIQVCDAHIDFAGRIKQTFKSVF